MSKSYKAASSVGAVALVLSGSVMAAAPAFDNWSVNSGTISSGTCASGFSCGSAMSDVGFFQRMVTNNSTGEVFYQTIITENTATAASTALGSLAFADENFVRTGNVTGIADKQRIAQTSSGTAFTASTTLASGWAGNDLTLTQGLHNTADAFQTDFIFRQVGGSTNPTAVGMKITAYVPIDAADSQSFALVNLKGDFANVASNVSGGKSTVTYPGSTPATMSWTNDTTPGSVGTAGTTEGDNIKAIYIGQDMTALVGQAFGFNSYNNLTTSAAVSGFSLSSTAAVGWDTAVWGSLTTTGVITSPF